MTTYSGSDPLHNLPRRLRFALAAPLLVASIGLISPSAHAQRAVGEKAVGSEKLIPMSEKELFLSIVMGQGFVCKARSIDVEIKKALESSIATVVGVIRVNYGSQILDGGEIMKLTDKELEKLVYTEVVLRASNSCPQLIPDDMKAWAKKLQKKMDEIYRESREATQNK